MYLNSRLTHGLLFVSLAIAAGCNSSGNAQDRSIEITRPVSFVPLQLSNPRMTSLVAGAVGSWKQEMLGFEVEGLVNFALEPGALIRGRIKDESGNVVQAGTVLASIGNQRYRIRRQEAEASIANIRAELNLAKKELERQRRLFDEGAGAQGFVDTARAKFESARARHAEARESFQRSDIDVSDTTLFAPFDGQISKVHVIPGGFVERGQPVVTVQMMDPLKIQVAVSPKVDRETNFNDLMNVYVDGEPAPLQGWVWHKDPVADAATRTFMVTLLVRNRLLDVDSVPSEESTTTLRTKALWNLESEDADKQAPYFTNVDTLHKDAEGDFVWKAQGVSIANDAADVDRKFQITKVRVTPGDRTFRYLQLLSYRELADIGELDPATDLVTGQLPPNAKEGDTVYLDRKRWLLRPGQLVNVDLQDHAPSDGYYAPAEAIVKGTTGHHVFIVEDHANGVQTARKVEVHPGANIGALQAILPSEDESFGADGKLIIDGAHYLRDGEHISAFAQHGDAQ